jgi:hypothetical protein
MIIRINHRRDKEKAKLAVDALPEDRRWLITVQLIREKRSIKQNRLYRLWLNVIADDTGTEEDYLHDLFAELFLPKVKRRIIGVATVNNLEEKPISTTLLNTKEFTDYLEKIRRWAIENVDEAIILPNPDDRHIEELIDRYENRFHN